MLKISDISIEKLKSKNLKDKLPELFELKKFIENNEWHDNDSVFNHTLNVLIKLKETIRNITNKEITSYLNERIDKYKRKDLLFLAALFHDIGKTQTFLKLNKYTLCPKHEEKGSKMVKPILDRFDLSEKEKQIVIKIIKHHGEIHNILDPKNPHFHEQYKKFKSKYKDVFIELILLGLCDTLGSHLKNNKPEEFNFRINFYKKVLDISIKNL